MIRMTWGIAMLAGVAACSAPKVPHRTIEEMVADPVMLQEVLDRCAASSGRAAADIECSNARLAVEKRGVVDDAVKDVKKQADFERLRAERRAADDRRQQEAEASKKPFDPYSTPVNPEPAPPKP